MLVLGTRRQYGCLSYKVESSDEQFLSLPDACQYSPDTVVLNRHVGGRKQGIPGVCLYHKTQNAPVLRKKITCFLRKDFNYDRSEEREIIVSGIMREAPIYEILTTNKTGLFPEYAPSVPLCVLAVL